MPVHDVAARGFGREAQTYERSRPTYPAEAISWLVEQLRIGPEARVCDLAAGTGKLTRLLTPTGATLIAVDPIEAMWRVLHAALPEVALVAATAEALPFAAATFDAITVAQGFHWFDADVAALELQRVLRPGGRLGLLWNAPDRSIDWVDQLWSIMDRLERETPGRDHDPRVVGLDAPSSFGSLHAATFHHAQSLTPEGVVERFRGVSRLAALSAEEQAPRLDAIRTILVTHPQTAGQATVEIPYRVDAYWAQRR